MPKRSEAWSYVHVVDGALEKIGQEDPESILPEMMKAVASDEWCLRLVADTVYGSLGEKSLDVSPKFCEAIKYDTFFKCGRLRQQKLGSHKSGLCKAHCQNQQVLNGCRILIASVRIQTAGSILSKSLVSMAERLPGAVPKILAKMA